MIERRKKNMRFISRPLGINCVCVSRHMVDCLMIKRSDDSWTVSKKTNQNNCIISNETGTHITHFIVQHFLNDGNWFANGYDHWMNEQRDSDRMKERREMFNETEHFWMVYKLKSRSTPKRCIYFRNVKTVAQNPGNACMYMSERERNGYGGSDVMMMRVTVAWDHKNEMHIL